MKQVYGQSYLPTLEKKLETSREVIGGKDGTPLGVLGFEFVARGSPNDIRRGQPRAVGRGPVGARVISCTMSIWAGVVSHCSLFVLLGYSGIFISSTGDVADVLAEGPFVAFAVFDAVGSVAVKLIFRFGEDFSAGGAGALTVGVNVVHVDVEALGVGAADGFGALGPVGPGGGAEHEHAVGGSEFGVHDVAFFVGDLHAGFKTEGFGEPIDGGGGVFVKYGCGNAGHVFGGIFGPWLGSFC